MDSEKKPWFRAKRFGLGWRPVTWQGWVLTAIYVIGLIHYFLEANREHSASDFLIHFGFDFVLMTFPLLIIIYLSSWGKQTPKTEQ